MAGTHRKGSTDADGNGKQGGSLPKAIPARVAKLEEEVACLRELARLNGWSDA
jgi:hypothetical protein